MNCLSRMNGFELAHAAKFHNPSLDVLREAELAQEGGSRAS